MFSSISIRIIAAVPNPPPNAPPGVESKANTALGWLKWGSLACCVAGLFIAGAMMAVRHHRGMGGGETVGAVGAVLIGIIVISAAGFVVGALGG